MSESTQHPFPGMQTLPDFNPFEQQAVDILKHYLNVESNGPLLTNDEDDLVIESDPIYFDAINRRSTPRNALQLVRSGELTDVDIESKRRSGRAIIRGLKADMFAERLMTATYASDTCRSLYRVATKGELIPIEVDDTTDTLTHRVGDYVDDLLRAGRERRILKNAAMLRITDKIRGKFDTDPNAQLQLTAMAGKNSMKKVAFWMDSLFGVSRGYERVTAETKAKLLQYLTNRPEEYLGKPDVLQMLADKKRN
jgi:hypothetical protein